MNHGANIVDSYRTLFDMIDEGACLIERLPERADGLRDYRVIDMNRAMQTMFGIPDLSGQSVRDNFPDKIEAWYDDYDRVLLTGENVRLERRSDLQGTMIIEMLLLRVGDDASRRLLMVMKDVTTRRQAEDALRESEERFRAFVTTSADAVFCMSADWSEMRHLEGRTFLPATLQPNRAWLDRYILREDQPMFMTAVERAIATKSMFDLEHRVIRLDGTHGWTRSRAVPVLSVDGAIKEWIGTASDVTASHNADEIRQGAEKALRDREADLARVQRIGGVGGLDIDITGGMRSWRSPEYLRLHGLPPDIREEHPDDWLARVHVEDRDRAEAGLQAALMGTDDSYDGEYRIVRQSDGAVRWIQARADIERDAKGRATRLVGAHIDVTEQKEMQEALLESESRLQVLVAELQHRVRNILTVVRSVLSRSLHDADDIEDAVDHFRGRLDALARTQVVVTQSVSGTADLETLIRDELLSVGVSDSPLLTVDGPRVVLSSKQAETLGLALHELTTNALKYGALKIKAARLDIVWNINTDQDGTPMLNLCWSEQGVPAIALEPDRDGFGRELIEQAMPYRLGAETKLEFRGGGVCCSIAVPLGTIDQVSSSTLSRKQGDGKSS